MQANAEEPSPYIVEVSDVTAKVGDPAVLRATLRVRDDYRILKGYNNRLIKLSSFDDGVVFERGMVPAALDEGALVPGRFTRGSTLPPLVGRRSPVRRLRELCRPQEPQWERVTHVTTLVGQKHFCPEPFALSPRLFAALPCPSGG